jgi:hypothetical protein
MCASNPKHKTPIDMPLKKDATREDDIRETPRLKKKNNSGKAIIHLAQDLVAKKCGVIKEDESLDKMTLQNYLDLYKQPLTDSSTQAIMKLTKVAVDKVKKKRKD